MRIRVFARRADPAHDLPILKKSRLYAEEQVASGLANWVDARDPRKGIIAREYLPSGKALAPDTEQIKSLAGMPYLKFVPPKRTDETTVLRVRPIPALDRELSAAIAG